KAGTRRSTTSRRPTRATSTSTQPKTPIEQVGEIAERAVLVPVGASLLVRDNLVSTARGLVTKYRTRARFERELKRHERRAASAPESAAAGRVRWPHILAGERSTLSSLNRRGVTKVAPRRSLRGFAAAPRSTGAPAAAPVPPRLGREVLRGQPRSPGAGSHAP